MIYIALSRQRRISMVVCSTADVHVCVVLSSAAADKDLLSGKHNLSQSQVQARATFHSQTWTSSAVQTLKQQENWKRVLCTKIYRHFLEC